MAILGHYKAGVTSEGGVFIRLINKTGAPLVKGTIVEAGAAVDESFDLTGATEFMPIGVVRKDGVADGGLCAGVI